MQKRCIFHIPNKLDEKAMSGSQVRPRKMMQAFKNIGYEVDIVQGYAGERKEQIKQIKQNIKNGITYDFLYSESSTMPTLLTEPHHMPTHPFLDFSFFKFCKKHGIKIGLFYRDIYWKFPIYDQGVSGLKKHLAISMYKHDLKKYNELLDVLYLPTKDMVKYTDIPSLAEITEELPPASVIDEQILESRHRHFVGKSQNLDGNINIFYVGGIDGLYNFEEVVQGITELQNVKLTVCCRTVEWERCKSKWMKIINDNVSIVHGSGAELEKYYSKTDLFLVAYKPDEYLNIAIQVKLLEALAHVTPVISTADTATGKWVEKNMTGWSIPYGKSHIKEFLNEATGDYNKIYEKHLSCMEAVRFNRWEDRALKVVGDLTR